MDDRLSDAALDELFGKVYAHCVIKYDPAAGKRVLRQALSAAPRPGAGDASGVRERRYGPYGYIVIPNGLDEEHWRLEDSPEADPEYTSIALFAEKDPFAGRAAPAPADGEAVASMDALIEDCWSELCERDDRTSPPECPDMCLITTDELAEFMERARAMESFSVPNAEPVSWRWRAAKSSGMWVYNPDVAWLESQGDAVEKQPLYATSPAARSEPAAEMVEKTLTQLRELINDESYKEAYRLGLLHAVDAVDIALQRAALVPEAPGAQEETQRG